MVCYEGSVCIAERLTQPVFPLRPLHASHDMISLLNLGGLYDIHVKPYAANTADEGQGSDDEGGQTANKTKRRMKIEKGYQHLLPDCIGKPRISENTYQG